MLTDERELDLLNLLHTIAKELVRMNVQQKKMVQALERLAEAFQEQPDGGGPDPMRDMPGGI